MRENKLKSIWARGEAVVNGWLSIPSSFSAEVMANQGFDSLTVDMQHGVIDYQVAVTMLQGISTTGAMPMARVPWNDPARLMKILDAGARDVRVLTGAWPAWTAAGAPDASGACASCGPQANQGTPNRSRP